MDKGIGTEMEGRAFKILGTKCFNSPILKLHFCLEWDDNFNSHRREKPLSYCIVMMSKERSLRHVSDFSRAEASYKQSYYLYASMTAWKSHSWHSQKCLNPHCLAVIPLGRITISAHLYFYK